MKKGVHLRQFINYIKYLTYARAPVAATGQLSVQNFYKIMNIDGLRTSSGINIIESFVRKRGEIRHAPGACPISGQVQRVGIFIPSFFAASRIVAPGATATIRLSIVKVTKDIALFPA